MKKHGVKGCNLVEELLILVQNNIAGRDRQNMQWLDQESNMKKHGNNLNRCTAKTTLVKTKRR